MKKEALAPIFVLSLICLFVTGVLSISDMVTRPVIDEASAIRAEEARKEIMPNAGEFMPIYAEGFPNTITEAFEAANNAGYIFIVTAKGYGGNIVIMCGIGPDGRIIKTMTLAEMETRGLSTPVFEMEGEYTGKDKSLEGIDAVTGATITSNAYMGAVRDAFAAFEIVRGMQ
ncbi:MAG: FMN-binding protein [Oscillospiraceae bacterium]|nr:FMN-binding protein [Oscillospiraceae bacterium]